MAILDQSKYNYLLEQNKSYMDCIALSFEGQKITYEEFHENINKYANVLRSKGIKAGDKVGVCVVNTPESVYILYALDVLGATVIGLNPFDNEVRIRNDIELTRPSVIISVDLVGKTFKKFEDEFGYDTYVYPLMNSSKKLIPRVVYNFRKLKQGNFSLSRLNNLSLMANSESNCVLKQGVYVPNLTTDIMFTGGSTGSHKGVELDGSGLNYVVESSKEAYDFEPGMIYLGNIPVGNMCFGKAVMHMTLCNNMEFALTMKMMPEDFYEEIVRTRANCAAGGPPHWMSLLSKNNEGFIVNPKVKQGSLSFLKYAGSGGENLKHKAEVAINGALQYAGSDTRLGNGYGATEAWSCMILNTGRNATPGTLGNKMSCLTFKIVDPFTFEVVKPGQNGLLLVSGKSIMKGYYENEDETNDVFITDENGIVWYNTGDIICELSNGEYKYVDRVKRSFVCGIENIYPEVIEGLLLQIPEIREVVVTKVSDDEKQYIPKYTISVYNYNFDTKKLESRIKELILSNLSSSWLPGDENDFIEYTDQPLRRMSNDKIDINFYQRKTNEQFSTKNPKRKVLE